MPSATAALSANSFFSQDNCPEPAPSMKTSPSSTSPPPLPLKVGQLGIKSAQMLQQQSISNSSSSDWIEMSAPSLPPKENAKSSSKRKLIPCTGVKSGISAVAASAGARLRGDEAVVPLLPRNQSDVTQDSVNSSNLTENETSETSSQSPLRQQKGRAPKPPGAFSESNPDTSDNFDTSSVVLSQPQRSNSVSKGLQVEPRDLIEFSNGQNPFDSNENIAYRQPVRKKAPRERPDDFTDLEGLYDDEYEGEEIDEEDDDDDDREDNDARTADEQMDYLESLESCPCYAKCCIDSIITLFCVTLLG